MQKQLKIDTCDGVEECKKKIVNTSTDFNQLCSSNEFYFKCKKIKSED